MPPIACHRLKMAPPRIESARSAELAGLSKRAATSRIRSNAAYPKRPGQAVLPTSRWAKMLGSTGVTPRGKWVYGPPAEVRAALVPRGSTRSMASRHPNNIPTECTCSGVGSATSKLPIMATAQVLRLKPPVCEPSTGLVMPPNRPSKTWPYLSTKAL